MSIIYSSTFSRMAADSTERFKIVTSIFWIMSYACIINNQKSNHPIRNNLKRFLLRNFLRIRKKISFLSLKVHKGPFPVMSFRSDFTVFTRGYEKEVRKGFLFDPRQNDATRRRNRFEYRKTTAGLKTLRRHEKEAS